MAPNLPRLSQKPRFPSRMVSKSLKTAGIKRNGSCYLLRHTCVTHVLEGGDDIRYMQQLLGHASLGTIRVYTQVTIQKLRRIHSQTGRISFPPKRPCDMVFQ